MDAHDAPEGVGPVDPPHGEGVAAQHLVGVRSCSRLGRRANPPRSTLTDWLLAGRR
jgi:hypothetical protein